MINCVIAEEWSLMVTVLVVLENGFEKKLHCLFFFFIFLSQQLYKDFFVSQTRTRVMQSSWQVATLVAQLLLLSGRRKRKGGQTITVANGVTLTTTEKDSAD